MQNKHLNQILSAVILFFFPFTFLEAQSQSAYLTQYVKGTTGNKLEVLDWGGSGKPILFLSPASVRVRFITNRLDFMSKGIPISEAYFIPQVIIFLTKKTD